MKGELKIYLGYAAGTGKTYRMLQDSARLAAAGADIVVGYFESHGRLDTIAQLDGLELIPRRRILYRGIELEEMDLPAILARRPTLCAVDEFPHSNAPGVEHAKRWEDVLALLEAGIDVLTTMNIQHLESLNDQVRQITSITVRETIPDWVVRLASEVVLIDLPAQALLNRLERGVVYAPGKARQAMENFFREPALAALRELALRQAAREIDSRQTPSSPPAAAERILLHITHSPSTLGLIRRGRRVADYLKADCFAVSVLPSSDLARLPKSLREPLQRHLDYARSLRIDTRVLAAEDAPETLVEFARRNAVTQILLARPTPTLIPALAKLSLPLRVLDLAKELQVTIVSDRRNA